MDSLPDDCLSAILSKTSPWDVCQSSEVSTRFRTIAGWDSVWECLLPADYSQIIARTASPLPFDTKKQLYFLLADSHIILDGRSLSFALDKKTGKKCYMLGARELAISWGDTRRYWRWITLRHSRFPKVAHLLNVCWLEIRGKMDTSMLSPNTTYAAYLVYKLTNSCGFESTPIKASVSFVGEGREQHEQETGIVYLQTGKTMDGLKHGRTPRKRNNKWMEIELGEFYTDRVGDGGGEVEMVLMEVELGTLKSGLTVEGFEVRPKSVDFLL